MEEGEEEREVSVGGEGVGTPEGVDPLEGVLAILDVGEEEPLLTPTPPAVTVP